MGTGNIYFAKNSVDVMAIKNKVAFKDLGQVVILRRVLKYISLFIRMKCATPFGKKSIK